MKQNYKHIHTSKEKKLYAGLDKVTNSILGKVKNLFINKSKLRKDAKKIYDQSLAYQDLNNSEINQLVFKYQSMFKLNRVDKKEFINAFAIVVEICYRETDKRAYEVQIMGAIALVEKYAIEMATGEGKTLTASLAAIILGWRGKPVHVLTSNDYLAQRDAQDLKQLYNRANLTVSAVIGTTKPPERKEFYKSDLVYSTGKEILADYLKDRMLESENYCINTFLINKINNKAVPQEYLLRGLDTVIVDEADSVLADDAVTPLIISSTHENKILQKSVVDANRISQYFNIDEHYTLSEKFHDITITQKGLDVIESNMYSLSSIWRSEERSEFLVKQALMAKELFLLNKHYIIKDEKIVIVDEKTGRIMNERTWGNGLHQAIEVKEGVPITDPTTTFAKMSFQRFFRLYNHLCGMSGTLQNLKEEFWQIYKILTLSIPKRVPSKMSILKDKIYLTKEIKEQELVKYIKEIHHKHLPILVGITTIKDSESLANKLKSLNIECTLLNALNDSIEAQIVAQAGIYNTITIATNMAGRGTDIQITQEIDDLGGLQVITTQRDKSRRIDMQFFGRCARQGQNGVAVSFLSLEDSILDNYTPQWLSSFLNKNFNNKMIKDISILLYIYHQKTIEKSISKLRNKTLLKEFSIDDSMSYA